MRQDSASLPTIKADLPVRFFCYVKTPAFFRILGRDFRTAAAGFSTFSADFRCLGRDFRTGGYRVLYLFPGFSAFWVEISGRRLLDSLPFSRGFCLLGRDLQTAAAGISTFFPGFPHFG